MELQNAKEDENEKTLEASVVENDKYASKDRELVVEAEVEKDENENEVVETAAGEKSKDDEKFVETFMDLKPEEAAVKVIVEENKTENGTVGEASVLAPVEASSSGMKKPKGLLVKKKIVKKVKRLVKKKSLKGTVVQVAGGENVTVEQGTKEGITVLNIKNDEQSAEPSLGGSEKEIKKVEESVADYPQCSSGKERDSETSIGEDDMESKKALEEFAKASADDDDKVAGAEPFGEETLKEVKGKSSIVKSVGTRLQKGKKDKGTFAQRMDKENETMLQGPKEGVDLDLIVSDKRDAGASSGGNVMKADKAIEGSVEAPEIASSVEKKQSRKLRAKAKLRKTPAALLVETKVDKETSQLEQNNQENNNSLDVNKQHSGVEKLNSVEVNTSEGGQQKTFAEKNKQNQLTEGKTGLAEDKRRKKKRQGKQGLGSMKKRRKEVVAATDVTHQRMEERQEQLVDPIAVGKAKIGGLIFMCNAKTKPDCFRFSVMGVQEKRKDYVMGINPGLKLFLYDYDLKLLYGVFQASSVGGMKLERNAFGGSFPAQVRFKVVSDCLPLPESQFKKAIKENYNNKNKFKTELTPKQVFKLKKLFRPAAPPAQLTHTQPIPVPRDADRNRSNNDRYLYLSRTHRTRRNPTHASPPPCREERPRDLYLSEREYRTYGLRRGETSQHYPTLPPESSYRDRVPLESYRPSVDHDRLLRHAETERHDRREVRLVHLPERDYHHAYDHISSRRGEIIARNSLELPASAVALDSYRRNPYYRYGYHSPERPLASLGREEDDLYSRYVTADSLAEYYRSSSRRYPSMAESELPPSSVTSRYAYSGSLPYSHR